MTMTTTILLKCQDCGAIYPDGAELPPPRDLWLRWLSDEPLPHAECPRCGALVCDIHPPRVRIWFWWRGSPVRLTLDDGKPVTLFRSAPTEEGYSSTLHEFIYDQHEGRVYLNSVESGRDCDGSLRHTRQMHADITELDAGSALYRRYGDVIERHKRMRAGLSPCGAYNATPEPEGAPHAPRWHQTGHQVYDEFARAAGY